MLHHPSTAGADGLHGDALALLTKHGPGGPQSRSLQPPAAIELLLVGKNHYLAPGDVPPPPAPPALAPSTPESQRCKPSSPAL